ncbi:MAG: phosphoribosyltransferase [Nevskia sp.]|nr:phosphoribosyltransferase [Nevskia sp.]
MFEDRTAAGAALAEKLGEYRDRKDVVVLGLPRGGVPVAYEVARALGAELDVLLVRKIGVPYQPELAMGAIASGGAVYVNTEVMRMSGATQEEFDAVLAREREELGRREKLFRGDRPPLELHGRVAIVVDDGIATGSTVRAALLALRSLKPARCVVAVPVAPADAAERMADVTDAFVCVQAPEDFRAVGQFYRDFAQTTDAEVRELLARAHARRE